MIYFSRGAEESLESITFRDFQSLKDSRKIFQKEGPSNIFHIIFKKYNQTSRLQEKKISLHDCFPQPFNLASIIKTFRTFFCQKRKKLKSK